MTSLGIDFETRSAVDLKKRGSHIYAGDMSTGVWCLAYAFDDEPIEAIRGNEPLPQRIVDHVRAGGEVTGWNVGFELDVWNLHCVPVLGWPPLDPAQCVDTAAMAAAMSLPRDLGGAAVALKMSEEKDNEGKALMLRMAKPRKVIEDVFGTTYTWWDDKERLQRLIAYCKQDVATERAAKQRLLRLRPSEQAMWLLDHRINRRGIKIDLPLVHATMKVVDEAKLKLDAEMRDLTRGFVQSCGQVSKIGEWLTAQGVTVDGLAKDRVEDLLADPFLPPTARQVVELRRDAAKASTAKLTAMVACASPDDDRARGMFLFNGADTGRWAGTKIQLQNLPRPRDKRKGGVDQDEVIPYLQRAQTGLIEILYGAPLAAIADCIRGMLIAEPGNDLVVCDFSAIEARVIAWLADEAFLVDMFRDGEDVYLASASGIYGFPVNKKDHPDERQVGKVSILALGYQGGIGAFGTMAKGYDLDIDPVYDVLWPGADEKERAKALRAEKMYRSRVEEPMTERAALAADIIKQRWRAKHPKIVAFWYAIEEAAILAVTNPGQTFRAGEKIAYKVSGSFLWCQLPSGRCLCYPYPKIVETVPPWEAERYNDELAEFEAGLRATPPKPPRTNPQVQFKGVNSRTRKWGSAYLYGGLAAENVTQAVAADLLREAIIRCETTGYTVVGHVHDEVIAEVREGFGSVHEMEQIMSESPAWAIGLPVAAEGWRGKRYRK